jgi:hypothetical protein
MRLLIPVWSTIDWAALLIGVGAFVAMFKFRRGMLQTLGGAVVAGLIHHWVQTAP